MARLHWRRVLLLVAGVAALAAAVSVRLYELQVVRSEGLRERAERQHKRRIEVEGARGAIVDRDGRELAVSLATEALFAHPWRVDDPLLAASRLAPILGRPRAEILARLRSDKPFVWVDRFLEPDRVRALRDSGLPIGDTEPFGLLPSSKRYYPHGALAVHVVGFANIDGVGVEGVEQRMDEELRGAPGVYLVLNDGRSGRLREMLREPGTEPHDVVLTLDVVLQHIVERELDRAIRETGATAASAILLEPASGQVLALANRPAADPNRYGQAAASARINRAIVHQYEPGSTFKIVPMAAALDLDRVRPEQRFFCENGVWRGPHRTIRDISAQGMLTAREVLEKSSNIGMAKIVERLEPEALAETIRRFGFGSPTGIELPGEVRGNVPAPATWSAFTRASLSFGQEIGVTALQMASAMATVANGGRRIPPRVVLGTIDPGGRFRPSPAADGERVISERTARELGSMLEGVVANGTGRGAAVEGYRIAGKSGTAQKAIDGGYSPTDYIASFAGYGPVLVPRLVGLVLLDSPRYGEHRGGRAAAPAFGRIMAAALGHVRAPAEGEALSVARGPSRAHAGVLPAVLPAVGTPQARAQGDGRVPALEGLTLREVVARLAASGYRSAIEGHGTVVAQQPPPGTPLAAGESCRVLLAETEP